MMKKIDLKKAYQIYYSDARLLDKLKRFSRLMGRKVVYFALLLYYALKSPDTPLRHKALILSALGYLIFPMDMVPDPPPGGFTDDFAALMTCIQLIQDSITPAIEQQAEERLTQWFGAEQK